MTDARAFRGYRFPAAVILCAVRRYLRFPLSYRDLERMLADRGVKVDHVTLYRWVQRFAPQLERRLRRYLRPCRGPWQGRRYRRTHWLWRAVDRQGFVLDVLIQSRRETGRRRGACCASC
jgi:IS6 family transposase